MSEILHLLKTLINGNEPTLSGLALLIFALLIYKVVGKYIEELWFYIFPLKNYKAKIAELEKALQAERSEHEATKRFAERMLVKHRRKQLPKDKGNYAA